MSSLHCWVVSCRTALEKANVLLSMNHGMAHLDNIWGACGSNRPVKYLTNKVHGNKSVARLINASVIDGGTTAAAPLPFRPRNPALCGSCPLVTPYYCRLGDLLCYNCMLYLFYHFVCMHVYFVFSLFSGLFSFVDFHSVLWYCWLGLLTCKNRLPYNLYCVGGDVKHCTIQSNDGQVLRVTFQLKVTFAHQFIVRLCSYHRICTVYDYIYNILCDLYYMIIFTV